MWFPILGCCSSLQGSQGRNLKRHCSQSADGEETPTLACLLGFIPGQFRGQTVKWLIAQGKVEATYINQGIKTDSYRHAHRSAWCKQFFNETLFMGDSRLCQVDRTNQYRHSLSYPAACQVPQSPQMKEFIWKPVSSLPPVVFHHPPPPSTGAYAILQSPQLIS